MRLPGLTYDSPCVFSFRQRAALRILPPLTAVAMKTLFRMCRFELREPERFARLASGQDRAVVAIWHESMGFAAKVFTGTNFHTLTSYSYDGELAARVVTYFGLEAVRGSSSRGGSQALAQLEKAARLVPCVGFTLDGPRGPRRVAKPGAAILAGRTGRPIIPLAIEPSVAWRLRSWDQFPVPKPGARIACALGEPIPPPANSSREAIEETRRITETSLNALHVAMEPTKKVPEEH